MMKHALALLAFLTVALPTAFSQQGSFFVLNQAGKPVYRKQQTADKGITIYKHPNGSFATILPRDYFVLGDFNDTLELAIRRNKAAGGAPYIAECTNCTNIRFRQLTENGQTRYMLSTETGDNVQFIVRYEKEKGDLIVPPDVTSAYRPDPEIGYVRLQNTLTHYSAIPGEAGVNLAIVDLNHNGRADNGDFLSLSQDEFFYAAARDRSQPIETVKTIGINGHLYGFKLVTPETFAVQLTPLATQATADLRFDEALPNLAFGDKHLYDVIDSAGMIVVFHWSEYSRPAMLTVPALNDLSETTTIIGLHTGNQELPYLAERYSMSFFNVNCTDEHKNKLNLSAYPTYLVIDKSKTVVFQTQDVEALTNYFATGQ